MALTGATGMRAAPVDVLWLLLYTSHQLRSLRKCRWAERISFACTSFPFFHREEGRNINAYILFTCATCWFPLVLNSWVKSVCFWTLPKRENHEHWVVSDGLDHVSFIWYLISWELQILYWLSGLTCTDENFIQKSGAQRAASAHGVALVVPDTSPRKFSYSYYLNSPSTELWVFSPFESQTDPTHLHAPAPTGLVMNLTPL